MPAPALRTRFGSGSQPLWHPRARRSQRHSCEIIYLRDRERKIAVARRWRSVVLPEDGQRQNLNHRQQELHDGTLFFSSLPHSLHGTAGRDLVWFLHGFVAVDGQKVPLRRQRLRGKNSGEVRLGTYELFQQTHHLDDQVWWKMLRGLTTRNYPLVTRSFAEAYGIEKSAIRQRFIQATREKLKTQGGRERVDTIAARVRNARPKQQIVIDVHSGPWWVRPWPPCPGS